MPSTTPIVAPMAVASAASSRESLAATSTLARMSRPRLSVPSGCAAETPCNAATGSISSALSPQIGGPATASTSMSATMAAPARPEGVRISSP
ncbi:hypothetical protein [Nonomuraea recticatena]|uniref:hypothetical protein n=1 Tax=Nonomuraea recticatena TaxID=46178 RepID=UPI00361279A5